MLDHYGIVCSGHNLFRPTLPLPALTMHTHLRNGGDNVADINSLSEKVLLVSRGRFQKMEADLSCPQPPDGRGILYHDTMRVLINSLRARRSAHLLTEARPGKLLPTSIPHVLSDRCFHSCICFLPPPLHFTRSKVGRIAETWQNWNLRRQIGSEIGPLSQTALGSRCFWMYKKVMDASFKRLDSL